MTNIREAMATLNSQRSTRNIDDDNEYYNNKDDNCSENEIELANKDEVSIEMDYHSLSEKMSNKVKELRNENPSFSVDYRGFNTSIADMYRYPNNERVDCCSIACFGCLQADRNRFLVKGIKPPGLYRRFFVHVVFPALIFGVALFAAFNIPDPWMNEMLCYVLFLAFLVYFFSQCGKGSWKRRHIRRNILWAKHSKLTSGRFERRQNNNDSDVEEDSDDDDDEEYLLGQTKSDIRNAHALCGCYKNDRSPDFYFGVEEEITCCTRAFDCFANLCCAKLCGIYVTFGGFCGAAQESREIEALVRPGMLRIDYITMQPMMMYYPKIYEARHSNEKPTSSWFDRLSSFSQKTVKNFTIVLVFLFVSSLLSKGFNLKFGPKNYIVFCLTLLQSFIILAVVYWKHTKDISIDALIKFFSAGFLLSTTLAVFFELVLGIMVRTFMVILMAMSGIEAVEGNGYTHPGFGNSWNAAQEVNYGGVNYRDYLKAYAYDHPIVYTLYLLVVSFVLAALIEETCKYFGFRMVDHPDFYSEAEIEEAMKCFDDNDGKNKPCVTSFPSQNRSLKSRGAAITVSMVAVGVGFACCENLVYVFLYGKIYNVSAIFVLLARSLFPVHPIAMAIQSIGVCKRDLENDRSMRLGRTILPGLLFHGFYDFMLMWIYFMSESNNIHDIVSVVMLLSGVLYYVHKSRKQRERFAVLDGESITAESNLT